ncbi:oxidoreductase [Longispora fulva]|uniref:nitric oxide dioxygenase n=1 Tax=Longispora fulva TaxID=619741 RepID=A0A8J7KT80_9ACTN|nr:globin domain-containing protein [Longispora fulva]MBG6140427.1 NAD(P)H-flavin reductase [Longispora fulva]GIG57192.1 oxidoreductase [Longispora fulva]
MEEYDQLLVLRNAVHVRRGLAGQLATGIGSGFGSRARSGAASGAATGAGTLAGAVDSGQRALLEASVARVAPRAAELVAWFYTRLFATRPYLRGLFPADMADQHDRLLAALLGLVADCDRPDILGPRLTRLGRDHRKYGVRTAHYAGVGETLIAALAHFSGTGWDAATEAAWLRLYTYAMTVMTEAADSADDEPPYWYATVVAHELRRPDLAVLGLRPAAPYRYTAGQYTTVESSRLARLWKPYSLATRPGAGNLLELHVRALEPGGLSEVLVHRTAVGDTLRLGPPLGDLTLPADPRAKLLLVAGGTGLAPIKALLQEAIRTPGITVIRLLLAGRDRDDLYDLDALGDLAARHRHVDIRPVVDGEPDALLDQVPDLAGHEIYVAGPPEMTRAVLTRLAELDVPPGQVHHDPYY